MAAPGAAIWLHLAMGVGACTGAEKQCTLCLRAHFQLAVGWDTSDTAALVVGTAERLVQVNKKISLVCCFSSTQLGCCPQGQHQTSECLSLTTQGK